MYLYLFESISSRVGIWHQPSGYIKYTAKLHIHIIFVVQIWIVYLGLPGSGSRALAYLFFIREGCSCNMFACPFLPDFDHWEIPSLLVTSYAYVRDTAQRNLWVWLLTFVPPLHSLPHTLYVLAGCRPVRPPSRRLYFVPSVCYPLSSAAGWRMLLVETPSMPAKELHTINKPCPCSHAQYKNTRQRLLLQMKTES